MQVDRRVVLALCYGFAIGLAVGVVLESSGALVRLDHAIGRRFMAEAPPQAPEEAQGAEERSPAA